MNEASAPYTSELLNSKLPIKLLYNKVFPPVYKLTDSGIH